MIGPTGGGQDGNRAAPGAPRGRAVLEGRASKSQRSGTWAATSSPWCASWWTWRFNMVRSEREDDVYPQGKRARRTPARSAAAATPVPRRPHPPSRPRERAAASREPVLDPFRGLVEGRRDPEAVEGDVEAQERRRRTPREAAPAAQGRTLEEREVEVEGSQQGFPGLEMMQPPQGMEGTDVNFTELLQELLPKKKKRRTGAPA